MPSDTTESARPRVYVAGPDVYLDNAAEKYAEYARICESYGLEAVSPFEDTPEAASQPRKVFHANVDRIRSCGALIANMTPFRGPSMDVGTAFEMGFAYGISIPVFGWSGLADTEYKARLEAAARASLEGRVEDFGLTDSVMVVEPVESKAPIAETFETAVRTASLFLRLAGGQAKP